MADSYVPAHKLGLSDIVLLATKTATKNGFTESSVGEDIALMHSELSEALEDFRNGREPNLHLYESGGVTTSAEMAGAHWKPVGVPSELADVIIRIAHFAGKHNIDLDRAVREKLEFNETRPFRHGGKKL